MLTNLHKYYFLPEILPPFAIPPSCALLDIAFAKGGPEAIVDSYYKFNVKPAAIRWPVQQDAWMKVNWCLLSLRHCDDIIKDGVTLNLQGDDVIWVHKYNTFFSVRAKEYFVSKVVAESVLRLDVAPSWRTTKYIFKSFAHKLTCIFAWHILSTYFSSFTAYTFLTYVYCI